MSAKYDSGTGKVQGALRFLRVLDSRYPVGLADAGDEVGKTKETPLSPPGESFSQNDVRGIHKLPGHDSLNKAGDGRGQRVEV